MWDVSESAAQWMIGIVLGVIALLLFWRPLRALLRLMLRTAAGVGLLALFSPVGKLLGITLGVNLVNALVLGVLGAPGFGLLMMLSWLTK